jgi:hypothetical protein
MDLEKRLLDRMPERSILAAIANTEHWTQWSRHFGPPSRLAPQIKDANRRYVFTSPPLKCRTGTPLDDEMKDGQPQAKEVRDTGLVVHVADAHAKIPAAKCRRRGNRTVNSVY